jgi:starch synthase
MTNAMPVLIKKTYAEDPLFAETKVIYSVYDDSFEKTLNKKFITKISNEGIAESELKRLKDPTYVNVTKNAIDFSDAVIKSSEIIHADIEKHIKSLDIPVLDFQPQETYIDAFSAFYDEVLLNESVMAE